MGRRHDLRELEGPGIEPAFCLSSFCCERQDRLACRTMPLRVPVDWACMQRGHRTPEYSFDNAMFSARDQREKDHQ